MKRYLPILLILCACHQHAANKAPVADSAKIADTLTADDGEYELPETLSYIPQGFIMDTTDDNDSTLGLDVHLIYAYPVDNPALKEMVTQMIDTTWDNARHEAKKNDDPEVDALPATLNVHPVRIFENDQMVSIKYIITSSAVGGGRVYGYYQSINFNKKTGKRISLDDYFDFTSDSSLIINVLEKEFADLSEESSENPWDFYQPEKMDFNVLQDSVSFNFGAYALGARGSSFYYKVNKKELTKMIRTSYR
jgi:hypothetical protein